MHNLINVYSWTSDTILRTVNYKSNCVKILIINKEFLKVHILQKQKTLRGPLKKYISCILFFKIREQSIKFKVKWRKIMLV